MCVNGQEAETGCFTLPWTFWTGQDDPWAKRSGVCVQWLRCIWLFATPWTVAHQVLLPWDFPGKNTGVGCHFLLQGIFPTRDRTHVWIMSIDYVLIMSINSWVLITILMYYECSCIHVLNSCIANIQCTGRQILYHLPEMYFLQLWMKLICPLLHPLFLVGISRCLSSTVLTTAVSLRIWGWCGIKAAKQRGV